MRSTGMSLALCSLLAVVSMAAATEPTAEFAPVAADEVAQLGRRTAAVRVSRAPAVDGDLEDAAWAQAGSARLLNSRSGGTPGNATTFAITWDDQGLYVRLRAHEQGQETQRHGIASRDVDSIFALDGTELFLQPGGPGSPYYQVMATTGGSLFDERWEAPGERTSWNGRGIEAAGAVQADTWTLEVAIPFADLGVGVPQPGDVWRANVCRTEVPQTENTCWAPTGGGYHLPDRFGFLEFTKDAGIDSGRSEAVGRLVEVDGSTVPGTAIHFPGGTAYSDSQGVYRLPDLSRGDAFVRIESPRYTPYAATFAVDEEAEQLPDIRLTRRDPYRPDFELPPTAGGPVTWLTSSIEEPPDMVTVPSSSDHAVRLALLAAPDEYESRAVAFYAHRQLRQPTARIVDLHGPDGKPFPGEVEVRWTQRLLKRIQYTRNPEDAVFSWRYLWRESPPAVATGHLRHLVVTAQVPEDAPAGTWQGALVVEDAAGLTATLPVELTVAGVRLVAPAKRVGAYYRGHRIPEEQARRELTDIREHGGRVLVWHAGIWYDRGDDGQVRYNLDAVRHAVGLQHEFGIGPPYLIGTSARRVARLVGLQEEMSPAFAQAIEESEDFRRIYAEGLRRLEALEAELGAGEFVFTWMDEVFGRGRFEPWTAIGRVTRELSDNRIYITLHSRRPDLMERADPYIDVRGYHGHTIDWWLGQGHSFDDLTAELDAAGDEAWTYYNIRGVEVTPEWVRLCNGYWLWRSPLMAHTPWIYYAYSGSPFDDLDARGHDFAYAAPHPSRPEMVSSLEWEAFREGWDDLRWLTTLDAQIDAADVAGAGAAATAAADRARAVRYAWWQADARVPLQAELLSAADYARRKQQMAALIASLQAAQGGR